MEFSLREKIMPIGKHKGKKVYYAEAHRPRVINFEEVISDISEMSSLTTGDVRNAIDRIAYYLRRELSAGNTIQLGQIGTFKLSVGSKYHEKPTEVSADTLKRPKLRIIPNSYLKSSANLLKVNVDNPYRRKKNKVEKAPNPDGGNESKPIEGGSSQPPHTGI